MSCVMPHPQKTELSSVYVYTVQNRGVVDHRYYIYILLIESIDSTITNKNIFRKMKYDVGLNIDRDAGEKKSMRTR